nr:response regulator [Tamlana agarivorans]
MRQKIVNLLIIEDCQIIVNAYKVIIDNIINYKFKASITQNCEEAYQHIQTKKHDLILLDLQLPVSKNNIYKCGEDLGSLIRKVHPDSKIIILPMFQII